MVESQHQQSRHFSPYIRSNFKSTFSQKALSGRFLGFEHKASTQTDEKSAFDESVDNS